MPLTNSTTIGTPLKPSAVKVMLLGSGELGKEVVIELQRLGVEVIAVDRYDHAPAMQVAHRSYTISMLDESALRGVVEKEHPHFIVPEVEAIATHVLVDLEKEGYIVIPSAKAAQLTMNREGIRLLAAEQLNLQTSPYSFAGTKTEFEQAIREIGIPCVVKPVTSSSGKGQSVVKNPADIDSSWTYAQHGGRAGGGRVIVEGFVNFDYEITLLTIRHKDGISFCAPIGHRQEHGDYRESWQPHPVPDGVLKKAEQMAADVVNALGGRGIFGVEFFIKGNDVYFSELSPRPHDTGMVTMISQDLSQFALHVRAILGLPIPNIEQHGASASAALLVHGKSSNVSFSGLEDALSEPNTQLRLFGKPEVDGERRMGVCLARGESVEEARKKATGMLEKVKYRLLFLAAALCLTMQCMAQKDWVPGSIVKAEGDTLAGDLADKALQLNTCRFRSADGTETEYSPEQLKSFYVHDGVCFISLKMPNRDERKFATALVRGQADLLKYRTAYFLVDSTGEVFELERTISRREVDGQMMEVLQDKFKQTLMWKFANCSKAKRKIETATLSDASLIKVFESYNQCFSNTAEVVQTGPRRKSSFHVGVDYGYLKTQLRDLGEGWDYTMDRSKFSKSEQSFIGVFIKFSPGLTKKLSFDVGVRKLKFIFESYKELPPGQGLNFYHSSRHSSIHVPVAITYSFLSWRRIQPFVKLGTGIYFNDDQSRGYLRINYVASGDTRTDVVNSVISPLFSLLSEAGVNLKAGPVLIGIRATIEYLNSPLSTINSTYPHSFSGTQLNYGVVGSVGYAFTW